MHHGPFSSSDDSTTAGLAVDLSVDGEHLVLALSGAIDLANADALPAFVAATVNGDTSVRLDLTNVTFVDSSFLKAILLCRLQLNDSGVDFMVRNASPQTLRLLELTQLLDLAEHAPNR